MREDSTWDQQARLTADAAAFDFFGRSVAVSGDTAVVGALADDDADAGSDSGSAYVFVREDSTWDQQARLTADAAAFDFFGRSVAVSGDTAVVGAPFDDDGGDNSGSAYVFVPEPATLSVVSDGAGTGTVTSDPAGIDCGADCEADFPEGTTLTLTATPDAGSVLAGFVGCDSVTGDECTVALDADTTVRVTFDAQEPQSLPGVVTQSTGWALRDSLTTGEPTTTFTYGTRPLVPVMGDWDGDGTETAGTFEGGTFKLNNANDGSAADVTFAFGDRRGFPLAGDFDGNGTDDVAVYRNGLWQIHYLGENPPGDTSFRFGSGTWPFTVPVAGDWDGDDIDGIATYTYLSGEWNLRDRATADAADAGTFTFSPAPGSYPVAGDWDADGTDTVGVKAGTEWLLNNANDAGDADVSLTFGAADDFPVVWTQG